MKIVDQSLISLEERTRSLEILENIYHRGQDKIWDGKAVLEELIAKHGEIHILPSSKQEAIRNIFAVILWGELAAWKVSLQLAERLDEIEAKMAATSQAHDEARHFYVMRDYLQLYGTIPTGIPRPVEKSLSMVLSTDCLAKKLLGMQLMVEPIALTIFQEIRKARPEPVLADLLEYFERDEARHVALGIHFLPRVVKQLNPIQLVSLIGWQFRLFMLELDGLKILKSDFEKLNIDPEAVFNLAEAKQLDALEQFTDELDISSKVWLPIRKILRYRKSLIF